MPITDLFSVRHINAHEFLENVKKRDCEAFFRRFHYMVCDDIMESFSFIDDDFWSKQIYNRLVHELSYELPYEQCNDRSMGQCWEWFLTDMGYYWRKPASIKLNLVELFFYQLEKRVEFVSAPYDHCDPRHDEWEVIREERCAELQWIVNGFVRDLNRRLTQSKIPLQYYNGKLGHSDDSLVVEHIEKPFWELASHDKWIGASNHMENALDNLENNTTTAVLQSGKALEAVLREIAGDLVEQGDTMPITRCAIKLGSMNIISNHECEQIKAFAKFVRNENSHAKKSSSNENPIRWNAEEAKFIVEFCMVTIKRLIRSARMNQDPVIFS